MMPTQVARERGTARGARAAAGARPEITVRPARATDIGALVALWGPLDAAHAHLRPDFFRAAEGARPATRQALAVELARSELAILVAEVSGQVCGVVQVRICDSPLAPNVNPRRRAQIVDLTVDEHCRRRGIGRALLEEAARWSRLRGASQAVLTVWAGNEEAERFYRRLGFEPVSQVLALELER